MAAQSSVAPIATTTAIARATEGVVNIFGVWKAEEDDLMNDDVAHMIHHDQSSCDIKLHNLDIYMYVQYGCFDDVDFIMVNMSTIVNDSVSQLLNSA